MVHTFVRRRKSSISIAMRYRGEAEQLGFDSHQKGPNTSLSSTNGREVQPIQLFLMRPTRLWYTDHCQTLRVMSSQPQSIVIGTVTRTFWRANTFLDSEFHKSINGWSGAGFPLRRFSFNHRWRHVNHSGRSAIRTGYSTSFFRILLLTVSPPIVHLYQSPPSELLR